MIVKTTLKTNFLWELCVQGPRIMPLCIQQSLIYQMVWRYFLSAKIWFFHYFPWVITLSKTRKMLISPKPSRIFAIWCENRIQREICVLHGYSYHPNWSIISKDNLIRSFLHVYLQFLCNEHRKIHEIWVPKVNLAEKYFRRGIKLRILEGHSDFPIRSGSMRKSRNPESPL